MLWIYSLLAILSSLAFYDVSGQWKVLAGCLCGFGALSIVFWYLQAVAMGLANNQRRIFENIK